ncbi:MAG: molybdate ABC transporter permease subunit [Verrucomicrobia bacterium]|nr:MAG: molybdate ABC transporter permease subunit [Verrucomicrobiota bacterium]
MEVDLLRTLRLSLGVATASTLLILPCGLLLGWLMARKSWRGKVLVETLVALPLVIPPVATGLILLWVFGRHGWIGRWLHEWWGWDIVFTWYAAVIAAAVMAFPLLVRSCRSAFAEVNPRLEQVAHTLGAGPWRTFFTITLPLASRGVAAGVLLAFSRALGEFGATVVVAGNIPGKTATLSLSIYSLIELGRDREALVLMSMSIVLAFAAVVAGELIHRNRRTTA